MYRLPVKRHGWEPGQTRVLVQLQNTQTIKTPVRFFTAARVYSKGRFRGTFTCSGDNPLLKVAHHSNDIAHSPKLNKPSITNPGRPLTTLRKRRVGVPKVASSIPHRAARQKAARKASQSVTGRKRLTRTKARRKARIPSYGSRSGTGQRISKIQVQIRRCQRCCGRSSRQQRRRAPSGSGFTESDGRSVAFSDLPFTSCPYTSCRGVW